MAVGPDQRWPREIVVDHGDGTVSLLQDVPEVDWARVRGRLSGDVIRTRHCEECNDEAIQTAVADRSLDCFALLAMTRVPA